MHFAYKRTSDLDLDTCMCLLASPGFQPFKLQFDLRSQIFPAVNAMWMIIWWSNSIALPRNYCSKCVWSDYDNLAYRFAQGSVTCWAGLSKHAVLYTVHSSRMCLYGHPCLCIRHYNSDHHEPSELVSKRIFCTFKFKVTTRTIIRK